MGIEIPESLQWVAKYVVGAGDWPEGDETAMRRVESAWTQLATDLRDLDADANYAIDQVLASVEGDTAQAISDRWTQLGHGEGAFDGLITHIETLADEIGDGAADIEQTKLVILASLAIFAVEMAVALAAASTGIGAPAAAAEAAAAQVTTRIAIRTAIKQLVQRILSKAALKAAARAAVRGAWDAALEETALDLGTKALQVATGRRDEITTEDLTDAGKAALTAAASGAVTGAMGPDGLTSRNVPGGPEGGNPLANAAKDAAKETVAGIAGEVAGEATDAALNDREFSWENALAPENLSSAAAGGLQRGGETLGESDSGDGPNNTGANDSGEPNESPDSGDRSGNDDEAPDSSRDQDTGDRETQNQSQQPTHPAGTNPPSPDTSTQTQPSSSGQQPPGQSTDTGSPPAQQQPSSQPGQDTPCTEAPGGSEHDSPPTDVPDSPQPAESGNGTPDSPQQAASDTATPDPQQSPPSTPDPQQAQPADAGTPDTPSETSDNGTPSAASDTPAESQHTPDTTGDPETVGTPDDSPASNPPPETGPEPPRQTSSLDLGPETPAAPDTGTPPTTTPEPGAISDASANPGVSAGPDNSTSPETATTTAAATSMPTVHSPAAAPVTPSAMPVDAPRNPAATDPATSTPVGTAPAGSPGSPSGPRAPGSTRPAAGSDAPDSAPRGYGPHTTNRPAPSTPGFNYNIFDPANHSRLLSDFSRPPVPTRHTPGSDPSGVQDRSRPPNDSPSRPSRPEDQAATPARPGHPGPTVPRRTAHETTPGTDRPHPNAPRPTDPIWNAPDRTRAVDQEPSARPERPGSGPEPARSAMPTAPTPATNPVDTVPTRASATPPDQVRTGPVSEPPSHGPPGTPLTHTAPPQNGPEPERGTPQPGDTTSRRTAPPAATVRRFASNGDGHRYGEQVLGPARDSTPPNDFREAWCYTHNSWINMFFRHDDPARLMAELQRDGDIYSTLYQMSGTTVAPTPDQLVHVLRRPDLTGHQRQVIEHLLSDPDPTARIRTVWNNATTYTGMWTTFGEPPTLDVLNRHVNGLDRALGRGIPEGVEVVRGLRSVEFMTLPDGVTELGSGNIFDLLGTIQTETGYMSTSLGATPPPHFDGPYRMELALPAGTSAMWMGSGSAYPDQRELVLSRGLEYQIVDIVPDPRGDGYNGVRYLIRAVLVPPGGSA